MGFAPSSGRSESSYVATHNKLKLTALKFLSLVDQPAQETATIRLIKNADGDDALRVVSRIVKITEGADPLIYCWAFTCTDETGAAYRDLQGDEITEFIKAAEEFMAAGGPVDENHDNRQTSRLAFAFPMDAQIAEAMFGAVGKGIRTSGLMTAIRPSPEALAKALSGEYTGVSIEGTGIRTPADDLAKYNPNHDSDGRFGSSSGGSAGAASRAAHAASAGAKTREDHYRAARLHEAAVGEHVGPEARPAHAIRDGWAGDAARRHLHAARFHDSTRRSIHAKDLSAHVPKMPKAQRPGGHATAAQVHRAAADAHRAASETAISPQSRAGHLSMIDSHERSAAAHESAAGGAAPLLIRLPGGPARRKKSINKATGYEEEITKMQTCKACGTECEDGDKFCHACGAELEGGQPENITASATGAESPPGVDPGSMPPMAKSLARLSAIVALPAAERAHFDSLGEAAGNAFLAKSATERAAVINAIAVAKRDGETVVYTSLDGATYRKSDDPRMVELAKRADASEALARSAQLEKRAGQEIPFLKGSTAAKTALLRAVDAIADETTRKGVAELLKGANAAMSLLGKSIGSTGGDSPDSDSPVARFEAARVEFAKAKHKTDAPTEAQIRAATGAFIKTEDGSTLYAAAFPSGN